MNDCHEDQTQMARTAYKAGGVASESARRDRLGKSKGRPTAGSNHPASLFELRRDEPSLGRFFWDAGYTELNGAQGRDRTTDTAIFSRMLYQLSYLGMSRRGAGSAGL
jgi:hypothetical protein